MFGHYMFPISNAPVPNSAGRQGNYITGKFSAMPPASHRNTGVFYFATDYNDGSMFVSDGVQWNFIAGLANIPNTVDHGGTGITSATANGVILGGTSPTQAFQVAAPGTAGYVFLSNGPSTPPTFQVPPWPTVSVAITNSLGIDIAMKGSYSGC